MNFLIKYIRRFYAKSDAYFKVVFWESDDCGDIVIYQSSIECVKCGYKKTFYSTCEPTEDPDYKDFFKDVCLGCGRKLNIGMGR